MASMDQNDLLAQLFEAHRGHLRAVAYRLLGSTSEADDAVQETWLRLSRTDTGAIDNLGGWLTTVVGHVCLDLLRSRTTRREDPLDEEWADSLASRQGSIDPEHEAVMADSVGLALLVVLETLTPAERLAFVLHDLFAVPFEEIAAIVERSPTATRQLASRARRRVQGANTENPTDRTRQREVVAAFLAASRDGDFGALISVLDPNIVFRADRAAILASAENPHPQAPKLVAETRGATAVADVFVGRARAARSAVIDGTPGFVWAPGGRVRVAFVLTFAGEQITSLSVVADPEHLDRLDVTILGA